MIASGNTTSRSSPGQCCIDEKPRPYKANWSAPKTSLRHIRAESNNYLRSGIKCLDYSNVNVMSHPENLYKPRLFTNSRHSAPPPQLTYIHIISKWHHQTAPARALARTFSSLPVSRSVFTLIYSACGPKGTGCSCAKDQCNCPECPNKAHTPQVRSRFL